MRASSLATLRSNSQILEIMAAQLDTLAGRSDDRDEASRLRTLAARTHLLSREYAETVGDHFATAAG